MMTRTIRFGVFLIVQVALTSGVPFLQTIQNLSIYVPNDDITLVCCSQYPLSPQIFQFFKADLMIHSTEQNKNCVSYMFKITTQQDIGPYYCAYKASENGTYVQSNLSDPITFQFADTPLPPSVVLVPSLSVYTTKEFIDLACAPPDGMAAKGIEIYREDKKIHEVESLNKNYQISASDKNAPGKYYCKYWVEVNGRSISSSPSDPVTVNVTNVLLAPSLSQNSEQLVYIKGEAVILTCSFPLGYTVKEVIFYKNGEPFPITNWQKKNTYVMATLTATTTATFTCQYFVEISGRTIDSDSSNEVTISITEPPPVPSITLEPLQPVYITGETVSIICSVPHSLKDDLKSITFYKSGQNIHTQQACEGKCIYTISNYTKLPNGDYSCEYLMSKHGREISVRSQSVQVTFTDIPQKPTIILTDKLAVYIKGETVSIACSFPEDLSVISIKYFKDNQEIYKPKTTQTMLTYVISNVSRENTGSYTCQYWLDYSGRHISSHKSLPVSLTVEEIPQSPLIDLNPLLPVYASGESISIKCLPPNGSEVVHIQYFKDDKNIHTSLERLYVISSLSQKMKGNYSCGYMCNRYGRQIFSKTSRSVSITVVDIPPAPSIILKPKLPVYIKGENVSIICSLPEESAITSIRYFKDDQEIQKLETPNTMFSYIVSDLSLENTGKYKCQYWLNTSGRHISSYASDPISIIVEDPPVTPVLKLAPNLEIYVVGESLVLTCNGYVNARHNIYKDGQLLQNDFSHLIPSLQLYHNGNYTCTYNFNNKGRYMESSQSQTVNIYVIDLLPAPTLTLGGPIVKVEDGFKVTLNCSAPDDDMLRTFYYFSGTKENDVTNLTAISASFELELGPISHISYSCEYEQELKGRKIRSRRSQTISVQLSEASVMSPPVIAGIIGAVSLLLCFTLALWFYMKSKKYKRHNRFRFSWYWKEKQTPKKPNSPHPLKKIEQTNQVLDTSGEDHLKPVSRSPSCLSITTQKEAEDVDKAMNFFTFQYENLSEGDSAWNSSDL